MSFELFIKIGDILGESVDSRHKDEIDVLAWAWGVSLAGSLSSGGGGAGVGKAAFSDLSFTHHIDKASPNLFRLCATGRHTKEAKLTVRKAITLRPPSPLTNPIDAPAAAEDFLIISMSEVIVTQVSPAGNTASGSMLESVSLQFGRVDMEYKPQLRGGVLDAGVHFSYDIKTNQIV